MIGMATLALDESTKMLLAAGLWSITGQIPPELEVKWDGEALGSEAARQQLIAQACQHKTLPMLVRYAEARGYALPEPAASLMRIVEANLKRQRESLERAVRDLAAREIPVLLLKGSDLGLTVYPATLPRSMYDIDLLIKPPDLPAATKVLENMGYIQADVDQRGLRLRPLTQAEKYAIESRHYEVAAFSRFIKLPELRGLDPKHQDLYQRFWARVVDDEVYVLQQFDVHFNVSLSIDLADVWRSPRALELPSGQPTRGQSAAACLWFLMPRTYHEIMRSGACMMRTFLDVTAVLYTLHASLDWDELLAMARKYKLGPPIFYGLWHADALLRHVLPDVVPAPVLEALRPDRLGPDRVNDWGDFMPRLLGQATVCALWG